MDNQVIRWKRLDSKAIVPERKTPLSAGFDLRPIMDRRIEPGETVRLPTGLSVAVPPGTVGHITSRSSTFFEGMDLDGYVDADYRGEILLQVRNTSSKPLLVRAGDRIAQMIVEYICTAAIEVDILDETERGSDGFGSSGK